MMTKSFKGPFRFSLGSFWIASCLTLSGPCLAVDIDSLPEIADNTICNLGRVNFYGRAAELAREMKIPAPKYSQDAWSILSDHLLESCSDGQLLVVADSDGRREFSISAMKLLRRVCTDKDVVKAAAPENGVDAIKFSCQITKLTALRKALVDKGPPSVATVVYDPYDNSPENEPVAYIKKEFGGNQGGFLNTIIKLVPDAPILMGIVTWTAYFNSVNSLLLGEPAAKLKKHCESKGANWEHIKPFAYDKRITPEIMQEAQMMTYKQAASISLSPDIGVMRDILLRSFDDVVYGKGRQARQYATWVDNLKSTHFGIYQCSSNADYYWLAAIMPGQIGSDGKSMEVFIQAVPRPKRAN